MFKTRGKQKRTTRHRKLSHITQHGDGEQPQETEWRNGTRSCKLARVDAVLVEIHCRKGLADNDIIRGKSR